MEIGKQPRLAELSNDLNEVRIAGRAMPYEK